MKVKAWVLGGARRTFFENRIPFSLLPRFLCFCFFLFRIEFLRHLKSFFQIMFKIETKPCGEELKGGDKVLMTCVGIGFSNLSKTLKWYSHQIRPQRLQTKQKLLRTPKETKSKFIQDRTCSYIKVFLIFHLKKSEYLNKRHLCIMWFLAISAVALTFLRRPSHDDRSRGSPGWRVCLQDPVVLLAQPHACIPGLLSCGVCYRSSCEDWPLWAPRFLCRD